MSPSSSRQIPASGTTSFGGRLKFAQAEAGLTNEDLAARIGVRVRLLQRWRAGDVQPNGANLARLCGALNRTAGWFYDDEESAR